MINVYGCVSHLFDNVGHVITEAEEVLHETVRACLTGNLQLGPKLTLVFDGAAPLDLQKIVVGDAVDEYNPAVDFELLGSLREISGGNISVGSTCTETENYCKKQGNYCKRFLSYGSPFEGLV